MLRWLLAPQSKAEGSMALEHKWSNWRWTELSVCQTLVRFTSSKHAWSVSGVEFFTSCTVSSQEAFQRPSSLPIKVAFISNTTGVCSTQSLSPSQTCTAWTLERCQSAWFKAVALISHHAPCTSPYSTTLPPWKRRALGENAFLFISSCVSLIVFMDATDDLQFYQTKISQCHALQTLRKETFFSLINHANNAKGNFNILRAVLVVI